MTYAEPAAGTVHEPGWQAAGPSPQPAGRQGCPVSGGAERCTLGPCVSSQDANQS